MSVIQHLASAQNRRDEAPNIELAERIVAEGDQSAVSELVDLLGGKDKAVQSDCIKVLYEIGGRGPELIAGYHAAFIGALESRNNRLVWGAMTALDAIALEVPNEIHEGLSAIMKAAEAGSVIARDHAVNILLKLTSLPKHSEEAFVLLIDQLRHCPTNQLPMYAERAMTVIDDEKRSEFLNTLINRLDEIEKESKRKRVEKVIKKMSV